MAERIDRKEELLFLTLALLTLSAVLMLFFNIGIIGSVFMYILIGMAATLLIGRVLHKTITAWKELTIKERQVEERIRQAEVRRREAETERKQLQATRERVEKWLREHEIFERRSQAIEEAKVSKAGPAMEAYCKTILAELKAKHGDPIPQEVLEVHTSLHTRGLMRAFFNALEGEDAPCVRYMFGGVHSYEGIARLVEEQPKPIKQPKNTIDELLRKKLEEGFLDEKLFESVACFISGQVMQDPVVGEDGRTYDRFCLENIYYNYPGTYPHDRRKMLVRPRNLPRDAAMYEKIQALVKAHQPHLVAETVEEETVEASPMVLRV